ARDHTRGASIVPCRGYLASDPPGSAHALEPARPPAPSPLTTRQDVSRGSNSLLRRIRVKSGAVATRQVTVHQPPFALAGVGAFGSDVLADIGQLAGQQHLVRGSHVGAPVDIRVLGSTA